MGPLSSLPELWSLGLEPLHVLDQPSVLLAAARAREVAVARGLPVEAREALVTAVQELARNQIVHAYGGWMDCRPIERGGVPGVEAVLFDLGGGILEPGRALRGERPGEPASGRSLGAGFSGAYRLVDEMDVDIRRGEGTCLRVRKFATAPTGRREVAILGEPTPGEDLAGDHAYFTRDGDLLRFAVVDGVGHGPPAREAADRAVRRVASMPGAPLEAVLRGCDEDLHATRGAAMLLGSLQQAGRGWHLDQLSVGNIELRLIGNRERACGGRINGAVGLQHRRARRPPAAEGIVVAAGEAVAAFSDGIPTRAALPPGSGYKPALVIAEELFAQRRGDDDALVLVAK